MLCIVIVFGVHSFADWTWYVPGDALVALLCAGWLAGRGPMPAGNIMAPAGSPAAVVDMAMGASEQADALAQGNGQATDRQPVSAASHPERPSPAWGGPSPAWGGLRLPSARELGAVRVGIAIAAVAGALLAAWTEWQPQRSVDASERALILLPHNPVAARAAAQAGVDRDSLSAQALFTLSAVEHATGESALARATLRKAVRLQPSNPRTWLTLGQYDMASNPREAVNELRAAVYLDPESIPIQNAYVEALRAVPQATTRNRVRRPLASSTRRAPGSPPRPATATSSKPKPANRPASTRRV
jgi:tetratricopeptide (TPR) repeat protein